MWIRVLEGLWGWKFDSAYGGMWISEEKRGLWDMRHIMKSGLMLGTAARKLPEKRHLEPEPGLEWKAE